MPSAPSAVPVPPSLPVPRRGFGTPPFALLFTAAAALAMAQMVVQFWPATATTLPDTDDALRLVQVREFLAGKGWFDLLEPRLGLAPGYESHWSRLIDAGLGGLFLMLRPVFGPGLAERLMLAIWPMLWMLPALAGALAVAWRLLGREAALAVLLLAVFNMPGIQQFRPGRIDHHNVQIALALLAVAAASWADRKPWAGAAAGLLTGASLAAGLEGLPIHVLCGIGLGLAFAAGRVSPAALRNYGLALAAASVAAFLVTVGPQHWTRTFCDEIAVNSLAGVVAAGLGLAGAAVLAGRLGTVGRLAALAAAGAVAATGFALIEPQCLAGPYAMMDPAVRAIWLDNVTEMQPLGSLAAHGALTGVAIGAFPLACLAAGLLLLLHREARTAGGLIALAAFVLALLITLGAVKGYSYAVWLGLPLMAAAAIGLFHRLRIGSLAVRVAIVAVLSPSILTAALMTLAEATGIGGVIEQNSPEQIACTGKDNYAGLAGLPPGRVLANTLIWGPYILAWTPQKVVSGPYHRLSTSILADRAAWAAPPDEARRLLAAMQVDYLAICGSRGPSGVTEPALAASLWGRVRAGDLPPWLQPVPAGGPFRLYRVAQP